MHEKEMHESRLEIARLKDALSANSAASSDFSRSSKDEIKRLQAAVADKTSEVSALSSLVSSAAASASALSESRREVSALREGSRELRERARSAEVGRERAEEASELQKGEAQRAEEELRRRLADRLRRVEEEAAKSQAAAREELDVARRQAEDHRRRDEETKRSLGEAREEVEALRRQQEDHRRREDRSLHDIRLVESRGREEGERARRMEEEAEVLKKEVADARGALRVRERERDKLVATVSEMTFTMQRKVSCSIMLPLLVFFFILFFNAPPPHPTRTPRATLSQDAILQRLESRASETVALRREVDDAREELECVKLIREKEAEQFGEVVRYFGEEMSRIGEELRGAKGKDDSQVSLFGDDVDGDASGVASGNDEVVLRRNVSELLIRQTEIKNKCMSLSSEANTIYRSARKSRSQGASSSIAFETPVKMKSIDAAQQQNHHDAQYYTHKVIQLEKEVSFLQSSLADSRSRESDLRESILAKQSEEAFGAQRCAELEGDLVALRAELARREVR